MSKKQKYDFEFKLRLVTIILQGKESICSLAKNEGLSKSNLQYWLKLYEYYGEQGLYGVAKKSFTKEEKVQIIQEYQASGLSLADTSVKHRISNPSVLLQWNKKFQRNGFAGLADNRGRPRKSDTINNKMTKKTTIPGINSAMNEVEKLRIEVEYLRAENDYLKKLEALAQSKQAKKKKP
ncbi:Transposase [compost metagenome]|uniref:transposase n=1 Tax=Sphingobacterium anhuiense TaxID=493780 RepID=UPI000FBB6B3D